MIGSTCGLYLKGATHWEAVTGFLQSASHKYTSQPQVWLGQQLVHVPSAWLYHMVYQERNGTVRGELAQRLFRLGRLDRVGVVGDEMREYFVPSDCVKTLAAQNNVAGKSYIGK